MRSFAPSRRSSVPTWSRTRARALGEPRAIRYTIGTNYQSRRLDSHQHDAVYRTAASLFGHVGKQECRESNRAPCAAFTTALETVCSPRSTLLYWPRPCDRGPLA